MAYKFAVTVGTEWSDYKVATVFLNNCAYNFNKRNALKILSALRQGITVSGAVECILLDGFKDIAVLEYGDTEWKFDGLLSINCYDDYKWCTLTEKDTLKVVKALKKL